MDKLAKEAQKAKQAGLSYGQWKAMQPRTDKNKQRIPDGWQACEYCGKPFKKAYRKRFCDVFCRESSYRARTRRKQATE